MYTQMYIQTLAGRSNPLQYRERSVDVGVMEYNAEFGVDGHHFHKTDALPRYGLKYRIVNTGHRDALWRKLHRDGREPLHFLHLSALRHCGDLSLVFAIHDKQRFVQTARKIDERIFSLPCVPRERNDNRDDIHLVRKNELHQIRPHRDVGYLFEHVLSRGSTPDTFFKPMERHRDSRVRDFF